MDNGYSEWKNNRKIINKKRIRLILKLIIPIMIISLIVFIFGYDEPIFSKHKLAEFLGGFICLLTLATIITFTKYKQPKYIPKCNKCGSEIRDIQKDCIIGNIENLGTIDKIIYEKTTSYIKGKTSYPRGGYSMRVSELERTSETSYEINQKIPLIKRFHVYKIDYRCKNCNELFTTQKMESSEPLDTKTTQKNKECINE